MSTVLWANQLVEGKVESDSADKPALFKYTDKLDALCKELKERPFSELCDSTDLLFNLDQVFLPDGMESTDELMAQSGVWIAGEEAVRILESLIHKIEKENIRFGLLSNAQSEILVELRESLQFANEVVEKKAKFNFSIVL